MPARRSHKKSRQGCRRCKDRHLKCDENRPKCVNCSTANVVCPYEEEDPANSNTTALSKNELSQNSNASIVSTPSKGSAASVPHELHAAGTSNLNLLHLELLYWWSTNLHRQFLFDDASSKTYADTCIKYGLRFDCLMRQLLATSALSLSIERPEQRNYYHQCATQLQSEALSEFNALLRNLNEGTVIPAFLVSSMIGVHVFCDTFLFRENDFNHTLDALMASMSLIRGVRSIIGGWWEFLLTSELSPMLQMSSSQREKALEQRVMLEPLETLVNSADISSASQDTYREAIKELGQLYALQADLDRPENFRAANMIFSWPVTVPQSYIDLLSARRPEALVILAYYAVMLHYRRDFWAIGDAGKYLVEAISVHLGSHWDVWLAWPLSSVA